MSKGVTGLRLALTALLVVPLLAHAAGLGRLAVLSALGEPLRAEVEIVSLQPGEEDSLAARIASPDAFRQAGIEYTPTLVNIRVAIERRDGKSLLRLTSTQAVNDPFLDVLLELQWATGRLVREYTFLLDPPEYKGPAPVAAAPAPAPEAKPAPASPVAEPAPIAARPLASEPGSAGTHDVKRGDTLGKIARQNMPAGVTFNQMLIALYRANEAAFIRGNINLVRAGRILNIPDSEAAAAVDPADANRLVRAHMADFAEYRARLGAAVAAAPATAAPGQREVAGRIAPKPSEPPPGEAKDQLRLSKADPQKPSAPGARAAREDDRAASSRALQESQSRVTDLEKNVTDLQKLLELKNQQLAQLEQKAAPKPVAEAPKPAPVAEAPKPAAEASKPAAEAPKPAAEAPKPAPQPPKPAAKAAPVAKKAAPKAAPPPQKGFVEEIIEDPIALAAVGGVVVLLIGYGAWQWRRKKKAAETSFRDSVLGAAAGTPSVLGAAGQPAAAAAPPSEASVSQASVGGVESDEVDPIAEADVYMAYGRDAQAEEILKEALGKDANRVAVHAKLLEIYANRRDAKSFEQTALKVKSLTNGTGPEWDKAASLGRSIDAQNGLYGGAGAAAADTTQGPGHTAAAAAPAVDFDVGGATEPARAAAPAPATVDFDLGASTQSVAAAEKTDFAPSGTLIMDSKEAQAASAPALDFDLGMGGEEKKADGGGAIDFDLGATQTVVAPARAPAATAPAESTGSIDFDLNLDLGGGKAEAAPAAVPMDLSGISLDLGTPGEAAPKTSADPKWQEVATKLDLAKAYEEMGDKDGARELLNEVLKEGDAAQQGQAKQMLAGLA